MRCLTQAILGLLILGSASLTFAQQPADRGSNGNNKEDHMQFYRRNYRGKGGSGRSSSSASPTTFSGRVSNFMMDTSASLESFLVFSGLIDDQTSQNPMSQAHEELRKGFTALVTADRRGKNPRSTDGAFQVGDDGSVTFGGGIGGLKEMIDPEQEKFQQAQRDAHPEQGEMQHLDPVDTTTRQFADALNQHIFQRGTYSARAAAAKAAAQAAAGENADDDSTVGTGSTAKYTARSSGRKSSVIPHDEHALTASHIEHTNGHARRMAAQAASNPVNASKLYAHIPSTFCTRGAVAVSNETRFYCVDATSGATTNVSAQDFIALPATEQANCSLPSNTGLECVCPFDYLLGTPLFGQPNCFQKRVGCNSTITSPVAKCPRVDINDNFIQPVCYSIKLSGAAATTSLILEANTTCGLIYTPPRSYESFGVQLDYISPTILKSGYATLPSYDYLNTAENIVKTVIGPYHLLDSSAFVYLVDAMVAGKRLALTKNNTLVQYGGFFGQIYNFRRISDTSQLQTKAVTASTAATLLTGLEKHSYTFDLRNLDPAFISGGRIYMEAGFAGGSESLAADSLTVDISDLEAPVPAEKLDAGLMTAIIVIAVVVGIILLIILIIAVRSHRHNQQKQTDEEEEDNYAQ